MWVWAPKISVREGKELGRSSELVKKMKIFYSRSSARQSDLGQVP